MACERFRAALEQGALGGPVAPELEAHLTVCAHCRAALEDQRRLLATVDRLLETALSIEPSAGFTARVRRRVAEAPTGNFAPAWAAAAAAVLLLAGLAGVRVLKPGDERPREKVQAPTTAPGLALLSSPATTPTERLARAAVARPVPSAPAPRRPLQVLVPAGEDAAVLRFYDTVRGRVVDASALVARPLDPEADPLAPADVAVRPLDWEPVKLARIDDDQPALEP